MTAPLRVRLKLDLIEACEHPTSYANNKGGRNPHCHPEVDSVGIETSLSRGCAKLLLLRPSQASNLREVFDLSQSGGLVLSAAQTDHWTAIIRSDERHEATI